MHHKTTPWVQSELTPRNVATSPLARVSLKYNHQNVTTYRNFRLLVSKRGGWIRGSSLYSVLTSKTSTQNYLSLKLNVHTHRWPECHYVGKFQGNSSTVPVPGQFQGSSSSRAVNRLCCCIQDSCGGSRGCTDHSQYKMAACTQDRYTAASRTGILSDTVQLQVGQILY